MVDEDQRVLDMIKVQTSTAVEQKRSEHILQDLIITTVVADSFICMEWEPIEGISEYTIYRNGKRVARVKDCFFVDETVQNQEEYTYWIRAERPLLLSERDMSEEKFAAAGIIGFFNIIRENSPSSRSVKGTAQRVGRR